MFKPSECIFTGEHPYKEGAKQFIPPECLSHQYFLGSLTRSTINGAVGQSDAQTSDGNLFYYDPITVSYSELRDEKLNSFHGHFSLHGSILAGQQEMPSQRGRLFISEHRGNPTFPICWESYEPGGLIISSTVGKDGDLKIRYCVDAKMDPSPNRHGSPKRLQRSVLSSITRGVDPQPLQEITHKIYDALLKDHVGSPTGRNSYHLFLPTEYAQTLRGSEPS